MDPAHTHMVLPVPTMQDSFRSWFWLRDWNITGIGTRRRDKYGNQNFHFRVIGLAGDCIVKAEYSKKDHIQLVGQGLAILVVVLFNGNIIIDFGPEPKEH